ncbi:hypothetical protein GWL_17480 [Herbaspirillum sp. GW103]|nr:hypothetical protein GWL_17480 [Herbaspirillum sp. GW103]
MALQTSIQLIWLLEASAREMLGAAATKSITHSASHAISR